MNNNNQLIVLKFGTTSVCDRESLQIREDWIQSVAQDVKVIMEEGSKVVIFSSGGLATGKKRIAQNTNNENLSNKNILGAIGLSELLYKWQKNFELAGIQTATLVIREEDIESTSICDTILEMTRNEIVPIINENIPLQTAFNNDELASKISKKINATKFVLFTDTDGVFTDNPKLNPNAKHLKELNIDDYHIDLETENAGLGTGGMKAKLASAIKVKKEGIDTIIANGTNLHPLKNLKDDEKYTVLKES